MLRPTCYCSAFRRLVRLGSFHACWRQTTVTPIPKGSSSSSVANYRPISITSVLSKVFERLVSFRIGRFTERTGVLPTKKFKVLVPVMIYYFYYYYCIVMLRRPYSLILIN